MTVVNCKADLDCLVATSAFCHEPPLSERREIHESGAWQWVSDPPLRITDVGAFKGHWEPAPFATCPTASYALRQKMRERDFSVRLSGIKEIWVQVWDTNGPVNEMGEAFHSNECTAVALAALRALNVEFELAEGWDQR